MTPLNWILAASEVPAAAREIRREATLADCAAIASELNLMSCERLTAVYTVRPTGRGNYALTGRIEAAVTQACGVTLEPIRAKLDLPLDVAFSTDVARAKAATEDDEVEVSSLPDIEPIENGQLEIGRVVFETLAAGIEPYPRKPSAEFRWEDPLQKDGKANPFAVLAKLKS
jgi:uncharacterized metal-binding protein YceD (DUF177 family)